MVNITFGHLTTKDVNVQAQEVGWQTQRVTALSSIDAGSHFRTMLVIPDPEPLDALAQLYGVERAAIEQLIQMIDTAQQPDSILDVVLQRMSRYKMDLPCIKFLDINKARLAGGKRKPTDEGSDAEPYAAYERTVKQQREQDKPGAAIMYMDQSPVIPSAMFGQLESIGAILLQRLDPAHQYTVNGIVTAILGKMSARLTGTDLKGRLEDPLHDMLLANHLILESWDNVLKPNAALSRNDIIEQFFIRHLVFQMIERLAPILNQDITFLEDEVKSINGMSTIHAADQFKHWIQACVAYLRATEHAFKTMPVPRMLSAHSGVPGYYDLYFDVAWSRINYMTSQASPGIKADLEPLELNGFFSNVLMPASISSMDNTTYRTTRGHDSLGTEVCIPVTVSADMYHKLVDQLLVTGNERQYPRDPIWVGGVEEGIEVQTPFTGAEAGVLTRQVFPLRGSQLRGGMMGLNLPHGIQFKVLEDQIVSAKQPAALEHQMRDVPNMILNPPFEVYSPWSPRL